MTAPPEAPEHVHTDQAKMAYRLAVRYANQLMYVHGIGWHHYDGTRWAEANLGQATQAVLETLRAAYYDAADDKTLMSIVNRCQTANAIKGVLSIARHLPEFAYSVDQLDADPYKLNTANGTLNLETRELHPHSHEDRITKIAAGGYDPTADATTWTDFLTQVMPDSEERFYLQRVIGQAVHGTVREHLFPVLIGTGANGKGTAYGAITNALGDYATVVNPDLLMVRDRGGIGGPELMTLLGTRLVVGSETEEGRKLDEAVMKRLTGGDELTARRLFRDPVTWHPTHQLVYVTNALPVVKGNDPAVWRRIRVIPFNVVVPAERRDPRLPEKLNEQADAVLTWAVHGYFDYLDNGGMREPDSVVHATDGYRNESDAVARFVADECEVNPNYHSLTRELFGLWSSWVIREGAPTISEKAFNAELTRLGYENKRTNRGKQWTGLRPIPDESENQGW